MFLPRNNLCFWLPLHKTTVRGVRGEMRENSDSRRCYNFTKRREEMGTRYFPLIIAAVLNASLFWGAYSKLWGTWGFDFRLRMNILILRTVELSVPSQGREGIDAGNSELKVEHFRLLEEMEGIQLYFHLFLHIMVLVCSLMLWQCSHCCLLKVTSWWHYGKFISILGWEIMSCEFGGNLSNKRP